MVNIIAFEHIEKCAGTSIIRALREVYGADHFDLLPRNKESMFALSSDLLEVLKLNSGLKSISGHSVRGAISELETDGISIQYYTILRDPIKRMWSDYKYSRNVLGFSGGLEYFMEKTGRYNFLSKSLCGDVNYHLAIENLESRYALFGTVERFNQFIEGLSILTGLDLSGYKGKKINEAKAKEKIDAEYDGIRKVIEQRNQVDMDIYKYASECFGQKGYFLKDDVDCTQKLAIVMNKKTRYFQNLLFRNLLYKPYMGYIPFKNHALPLYKEMNKN